MNSETANSKDWVDVYEDTGRFIEKIHALLRILVSSSVDAGSGSFADIDIENCLYLSVDLMEDLQNKHSVLYPKILGAIESKEA